MDLEFDLERFYFGNITAEDVIREVLRLQGYRAIGPDGVHFGQLADGLGVLAPLLADLFNAIISSGSYPVVWKQTIVKMISKRLNLVLCSDCRPITLQCNLAKVFEGLLQSDDRLSGRERFLF